MGNTQQLRKEIIKMEKDLEQMQAQGRFSDELERKIEQAKSMLPEFTISPFSEG